MYSNVNNRTTNRITSSVTIRAVTGATPRSTSTTHLTTTIRTTGTTMVRTTLGNLNGPNVNYATAYTCVRGSALTVTRINSSHTCLLRRNALVHIAHSRSCIRRLISTNRVATSRTHIRPGHSIVAHTLNSSPTVCTSRFALRVRRNSHLVLYSSNLSDVVPSDSVRGVTARSSATRVYISGLISTTLTTNNRSGIAMMIISLISSNIVHRTRQIHHHGVAVTTVLTLIFILTTNV